MSARAGQSGLPLLVPMPFADLNLLVLIGRGCFGRVYMAHYRPSKGAPKIQVAVKVGAALILCSSVGCPAQSSGQRRQNGAGWPHGRLPGMAAWRRAGGHLESSSPRRQDVAGWPHRRWFQGCTGRGFSVSGITYCDPRVPWCASRALMDRVAPRAGDHGVHEAAAAGRGAPGGGHYARHGAPQRRLRHRQLLALLALPVLLAAPPPRARRARHTPPA